MISDGSKEIPINNQAMNQRRFASKPLVVPPAYQWGCSPEWVIKQNGIGFAQPNPNCLLISQKLDIRAHVYAHAHTHTHARFITYIIYIYYIFLYARARALLLQADGPADRETAFKQTHSLRSPLRGSLRSFVCLLAGKDFRVSF